MTVICAYQEEESIYPVEAGHASVSSSLYLVGVWGTHIHVSQATGGEGSTQDANLGLLCGSSVV